MTAVAPAWGELLSAALVGTERRPLPSGAVAEVAALVGADLPAGHDEHRLLTAAGVVAAYRRCGFPVIHDEHPPAVVAAAADERPPAPAPAVQILELLLTGQVLVARGPGDLVRHWLEQCVALGYRLPGRTLPALLDWGTSVPADRREPLLAAGGPALVWLAGHNDLWAWAPRLAAGDDDTWRHGDHRNRFTLLHRLRVADPAKALAMAQETWPGEKAGDRAEIVEALSTGRADADEPFLEAALDDRAASVRTAAAAQLAARPSSGLAQRMAGRLRPLVNRGTVELPRELDEAAGRDGVADRGAPRGVGLKAWWLTQMVAAAPLGFWDDPAEVIPTYEQAELRDGWAIAAARQRDRKWAAELLRRGRGAHDGDLLRVLPPDEAQALLRRLLGTRPDADVAPLLGAAPAPWPRSLTEAALARISQARTKATFTACLPHLVAADPAMADEVGEWLAQIPAGHAERRQINQLVQALSIRHAIAQAFSGD